MDKGELQRTDSLGFQVFDDELVFPALLENRDPAADNHPHAVFRLEFKRPGRGTEHDAAHLAACILEGEIEVAGERHGKVGDLPLHPDMLEILFKHPPDQAVKLADCEDSLFGKQFHFNSREKTFYVPGSTLSPLDPEPRSITAPTPCQTG